VTPIASASNSIQLLLVDDDRDLGDALAEFLKSKGLSVTSAGTCREALDLLQAERNHFDIVLTDLRLPDGDGLSLIETAKLKNPVVLAALMTGYASLETALKAIQLGAYDYITKPFSLNEIEILIRNMCDKIRLEEKALRAQRESDAANEKLREIYGKIDTLHDEKIELMRLNREMKREFAGLSNKVDQVIQLLQVIFPQANRSRWSEPTHTLLE
jgi:two-component system response regulator PilR (NtrC family)